MDSNNKKIHIQKGDLQFTFLNSGDIYEISHHNTMINQWLSNTIDGSLNNLYLRVYTANGIKAVPLLGAQSNSSISKSDSNIIFAGTTDNVAYTVTFRLSDKGIWFWDIELEGNDVEVDIMYTQDLGLADKAAVRSNEAYISQYLDHNVFENEHHGYVVCTRQNQPQQGKFPYLQQGALGKTIGYATDGLQFYGLSYKSTNQPEALTQPTLANEIYQYEFAYIALQSDKVTLRVSERFVFYGMFKEDHPSKVTEVEFASELEEAWIGVKDSPAAVGETIEKVQSPENVRQVLQALEFTEEEINARFPERLLEERHDRALLSFFTNTYEHVALKKKEDFVERSHGHILMSGNNHHVREDTITTNSYMYGLFNAQISIGNTNMNKVMTNARNPLNVMKTSGQRIYIEIEDKYHLLTMASMFEMGFNYARWYYKLEDDVLIITNFTTVDTPEIHLHVSSEKGKSYRYRLTNQITMNNEEYKVPFGFKVNENSITFTADAHADSADTYPDLAYRMEINGAQMKIDNAQQVAHNPASLVVLDIAETPKWSLTIQGSLYNDFSSVEQKDSQQEIERYREYYRNVMQGFTLAGTSDPGSLNKVNAIAWWYTHNMLVHFSVPHGLEQYSGAAWGTRDVSQGPAEYFMATGHDETVREIIKTVFTHQYEHNGNWPQWFMFDQYNNVQQADSHGDIIVWPLKLISDYLEATQDFTILEEMLPYTDHESFNFTEEKATLLDHIKKEIAYIKEHFLHHTALSAYGDGDWDDTLQPANANLKKYMISSWTVALTYEAMNKMASLLTGADEKVASELKQIADNIKADFNHYILSSDVIPGFVYMESTDNIEFMLHPTDEKTGIQYRLLPMQQSIISELFTKEQAKHHLQIIKDHLYFPDGVRLMNRPANYAGGISTHFKRAEQAANFGREVGLQYVHAHIRFVEAMAKMGNADEVWKGLEVINPIRIQEAVPNAEIRQSNAYFSSSDGKFNTRYEAQEQFDKLRDGSVAVKGGWRIYSSGPGIYMNQLISNALGIRRHLGNLVIDPILPNDLDGLEFAYTFMNYPVTFIYHLTGEKRQIVINGAEIATETTSNPYRDGGFIIAAKELEQRLEKEGNRIEIYM
ncbi:cellobiose phosphorylase [Oceanobacillus arenosus]|uniref:Cellobiose phosphorylase n=1 Tax=Oceanobacillus arenosus TaxID=1229153 RepID=A0A3D8PZ55_9BACI|nr:amylo-alpha-1,6-glucosidase [Oceanobacillus arenosus]RDW21470.1 cellobiose phosphorylase [Oceanobacillus arenosus]